MKMKTTSYFCVSNDRNMAREDKSVKEYSDNAYGEMIDALFRRFPSFQNAGASAYKPGIDNMLFFDMLSGHPHRKYRTIHVAGTNGKGSVANMLASVCAAAGMKVGLYTSPHILDFRERMRVLDGGCQEGAGASCGDGPGQDKPGCPLYYISKKEVWDYVQEWGATFDHLDLSFFEITTMMAFGWFASRDVDIAVIETGLGGRLDSTNIITPVLSVITNIGLDHCDMLGETLGEIAFEKAGIIKPKVPAVVGESGPETDPVFERKVLYANLPEPEFMGDGNRIMSLLTFADKAEPSLWKEKDTILERMDLQGEYQVKNLRTVLAAIDVLAETGAVPELKRLSAAGGGTGCAAVRGGAVGSAIEHTARRMQFHGRWEKLSDSPYVICDIGHNSHGLRYNFSQLERMMRSGRFDTLTIVYGAMADKDVDRIMEMFPKCAELVAVTAPGKRAMPAEEILGKYVAAGGDPSRAVCCGDMKTALEAAGAIPAASSGEGTGFAAGRGTGPGTDAARHLVYIGGSTYIVAEAVPFFRQ